MKKHADISIRGRVQKVGFRYYTRKQACALGITGFVTNCPDGSVYAEAEGEEADLDLFIDWCRIGPSLAEVTDVSVSHAPMKNFSEFNIH
jgi:acylphosphatase